ncbi:MAG: glycosyltransferase [Longimicrobiales bacterium]|nr:glycosyltransferase [Longimicrobiales bacterium]
MGLPIYNGARHAKQCIESLLDQDFEDFRIIISDNASTDATSEICLHYAAHDSRIEYRRNATNIGLAANFNLVFGLCRSKYFRWATADDFVSRDMLSDAVRVMEDDSGLALCYPRARFVDSTGTDIAPWSDSLHLMQKDPVDRFKAVLSGIGRVHHHLGLMRSAIVRRTGLFSKHVASDTVLIAELSLYGRFYQIPRYQFFRRLHEGSSSWAPTSETHQARLYHPTDIDRIPFNRWRLHGRLIHVVAQSPLATVDRLRAFAWLVRRAIWDREALSAELRAEVGLAMGLGDNRIRE